MVGTAEDYIRFLEAIRLGGAPILNPHSTANFMGDAIPGLDIGPNDPGWGFGLGVAHLRDPAASGTAQHAGSWAWGGVYGTSFWVDPDAGISAVALTNTSLEGCNGPFTKEIIAATYAE
jgi:CubicO group peptidase (beta-lactamase class C family)